MRRLLLLLLLGGALPAGPAPILSTAELAEYLRAGDHRLVRPSPSGLTAARQREPAVLGLLGAVMQELIDQNVTAVCDCDDAAEQSSHARAASVLHLLTTDNPANRALVGSTPDALAGLVSLVAESVGCNNSAASPSWQAAEEAAEAIWILSFNHRGNHDTLLQLGAAEALAAPVLTPQAPSRAKMWAAAALQNLAASYCATSDGRCSWRWSDDHTVLAAQEQLVIDSEPARLRIGAVPGLLRGLVDLTTVTSAGTERVLPSKATTSERRAVGIAAWAAAGALKNLALSPLLAQVEL
ncbi:hypothetical protein AB1Y20_019173 [Prymnesium parvum]|uniref:Protein HGH1 homolog n=1 Tax=Prymnesium parvum TaxID=97485 RepID=A0AB34JRL5_PRYPA